MPHTLAPWIWEKVEADQAVTEHTLKGPDVLCRYWYDKSPSDDALLIAAAPNLSYHAKTVLFHLRRGDHKDPRCVDQMISALEKVIAQSEGRQLAL